MPFNLRIELLIFVILFCLVILYFVKKDKLLMKYAIIWLLAGFIMFIAVVIPNFIETISALLGFEIVSNMIFLFGFLILMGIVLSLTAIVSKQSEKIRLLIQEVSILKKNIFQDKKEGKKWEYY